MIRPRLLQDLRAAIDRSHYFVADDFYIYTEDAKDSSSNLSVRYRCNDSYYLVAVVPLSASNGAWFEINMTVKPGSIADTEVLTVGAWDDVVRSTQSWLARIHEELQAVPVARRLAAEAQELEDLLKKYTGLPDEYFTASEASEMEERLEQIQTRMEENLQAQVDDANLVKPKIAGIRQDVYTLKETLHSLKKHRWAGALLVRVCGWMREGANRQILRSGADVARALLVNASSARRPRRSWPNWLLQQAGLALEAQAWDPVTSAGPSGTATDTAAGATTHTASRMLKSPPAMVRSSA
jgi:hypothetical protein